MASHLLLIIDFLTVPRFSPGCGKPIQWRKSDLIVQIYAKANNLSVASQLGLGLGGPLGGFISDRYAAGLLIFTCKKLNVTP
jgi:hypothetical protein